MEKIILLATPLFAAAAIVLRKLREITLLLDMDNTVAIFSRGGAYDKESLALCHNKGFYEALEPHKNLWVYKVLSLLGVKVCIVSACPTEHGKQEKTKWLQKFMPYIKTENIYLCDVGINKADFVSAKIGRPIDKSFYLLDDYGKNLIEWKSAGGSPIKKSHSDKKREIPVVRDHKDIFKVLAKN